MKFVAKNLEETQKIAEGFVKKIFPKENGATIVGLYGELGAGKTSFTQGVAKALGISENIVSPTFVIMKSYPLHLTSYFLRLFHIDAYRLEHSSELLALGWQEIISDPKNLILIEWPEKVSDIMSEHIKINISHISEEGREIEII